MLTNVTNAVVGSFGLVIKMRPSPSQTSFRSKKSPADLLGPYAERDRKQREKDTRPKTQKTPLPLRDKHSSGNGRNWKP